MQLSFPDKLLFTVCLLLFLFVNFLSSIAVLDSSNKTRLMSKRLPRRERSTVRPPYLHLPVYVDSREPLLDPEHFSPAVGTGVEPLPEPVQDILRPVKVHSTPPRPKAETQPEDSVMIDCKLDKMYLELDRAVLGNSDPETTLKLGTCPVTKSSKDYVYFEYELTQCGTKQRTIQDQVVFSNTLRYKPEKLRPIRRTAPFSLPVSCHFNRYQYSYKIGYRPKVRIRHLSKMMRNTAKFALTPRNALWERLSPMDTFTLGRSMFFEAEARFMSPDQRLYVHSCYATPEKSHTSKPQFPVVKNYGCMVESKDGRSSFIPHRNNAVRFSVDAFIFKGFEGHLFMHCTMSVGSSSPTATDKSCNYNTKTGRWGELYGSDSVCSCCESNCSSSPSTETLISSRAWNIKTEVKPSAVSKKKSPKADKRASKTVSLPDKAEETVEGQFGRVSWAVAKAKEKQVTGSAVVEEEEGTQRIFEELFHFDLYNLSESEIND